MVDTNQKPIRSAGFEKEREIEVEPKHSRVENAEDLRTKIPKKIGNKNKPETKDNYRTIPRKKSIPTDEM